MTLRPPDPARQRGYPPDSVDDRVQVEHELEQIRAAAHALEQRLDMAGWQFDRQVVHEIRGRAAAAIARLAVPADVLLEAEDGDPDLIVADTPYRASRGEGES